MTRRTEPRERFEFKRLDDHEVKIRIHPEVLATLKVLVTKEG